MDVLHRVLFLLIQSAVDESYRGLFLLVISLLGGLVGVPLTQFLKNQFDLKDKGALSLSAGIAALIAISELLLTHQLDILTITIDNFPNVFGLVFTTATIYYKVFCGVGGFFGKSFMVREKEVKFLPY